ncbi:MAG: FecR domain-containing protein [Hyphomicrobiaceae bacterium]
MRLSFFALTLILTAPLAAPAFAAPGDDIGSAIAIKNNVTAAYETGRRKLQKDDPVRQEEIIEVGEDSLGELKFKDDTKLALGPGSRMTLDKFVYDPDKTNGSIIVNLMKGTFRFITGIAAKPTYKIKTPSASISVRGTIFDVYIKDDGAVWLLLIEGAIEACTDDGKCRVLDEPGKFIRIVEDRKKGSPPNAPKRWNVGAPVKWAALPGRKETPIETAFPFVPSAPSFDPAPWYSANDIIIGRFPRHPKHPHHPPARGDNGGKGGKDGGNTGNTGPKPPKDGKPPVIVKDNPPVILKGDKPIKHRPPRVHTEDAPPKKVRIHKIEKIEQHIRKHTRRDRGGDTPVVKRRSSSHEDKPFRNKPTTMPKFSEPKTPKIQFRIGGSGFGSGGGGNPNFGGRIPR